MRLLTLGSGLQKGAAWCLAIALLAPCSAVAGDPAAQVQALGRALADKLEQNQTLRLRKLANGDAVLRFLLDHGCPGHRYSAVRLELSGEPYLYLIAKKRRELIIGRHFKAPMRADRVDMAGLEASTRACLTLGRPSAEGSLSVTHPQPLPNEFHVMSSLLHETTFYVRTARGTFRVANGRVIRMGDERELTR